jgi:hypothetical protein
VRPEIKLFKPTRKWIATLIALVALLAASPISHAAAKLQGRWLLTITIPDAPGSDNTQTFTVNLDASPRDNSLHGRLTITDAENRTAPGVWRQSGKKFSITYELPCGVDGPCATLVLHGKIKGDRLKSGNVIVMWDEPNDNNPALFRTSTGSFGGNRLLE